MEARMADKDRKARAVVAPPRRERAAAEPEGKNAGAARKTTDAAPAGKPEEDSGAAGRVTGPGGPGDGEPSPYGTEVQADAIAAQDESEEAERPARIVWDERREGRGRLGKPRGPK
jgi:hypothetical protein